MLLCLHAVSEVSTLQCCSSVEADLPLKIPTHAHKTHNSSGNCICLLLRIHCSIFLSSFSHFSVRTFFMWSKCTQDRCIFHMCLATHSAICTGLLTYETKQERRRFNECGLVSVLLLSGLGYKHRLVKYLSVSVRQLPPLRCSLSLG